MTELQQPTESAGGTNPSHAASQFASQVRQREQPDGADQTQPEVKSRDFSVFYDQFEAVKRINLDIPRGEVTAIIGPSGCGKSTFLNAINRMTDLIPNAHLSGSLMLNGTDIFSREVDVVRLRRRVGMVFQKPNPFPKSIYENVAYGPKLHGRRGRDALDQIVEQALREAGLWDEVKDRLRHNALSLSGGQQQRLCIARALAIKPDVLLLDEPTSALDPKATAHVESLIDELRGRYTILIVTHNMQQAARVSDYTAFMYEGNLVEFGATAELFTNPEKQQTEDYITGRFG